MSDSCVGNLIDLYSGRGGYSLNAHLVGFRTALGIDHDKDLSSGFGINFPSTKLANEDLSTLESKDLLLLSGFNKGQAIGSVPF
jgi:site-specific DNA-cytosine methylase